MFIRKAASAHFSMKLDEMGEYFEAYPRARIGHLRLLQEIFPHRYKEDGKFARKVSGNLGISLERAECWVAQYRKTIGA